MIAQCRKMPDPPSSRKNAVTSRIKERCLTKQGGEMQKLIARVVMLCLTLPCVVECGELKKISTEYIQKLDLVAVSPLPSIADSAKGKEEPSFHRYPILG